MCAATGRYSAPSLAAAFQSAPRASIGDQHLLTQGAIVRHELRPGQTDRYEIDLRAGHFIYITIRQHGIDVSGSLIRPDGSVQVEVDTQVNDFLPETVAAIADVDGRHELAIRAVSTSSPSGYYEIDVETVRAQTEDDPKRVEAERSFARGRALSASNRPVVFPQALEELNAALRAYRTLQDRHGELKTLNETVNVQWILGRREGLETARQAEALAAELDDAASRAMAIRGIALMEEFLGDLDAALRSHDASAALEHAIGNRKFEAVSLNNGGVVFGRTGDAEQAIARFERAIAVARDVGYRLLEVQALNNLGIAYKNVGEYARALKAYGEALTVAHVAKMPLEAGVLNNLGSLQEKLGQYDEARDAQLQALALARSAGNRATEARALSSIGRAYDGLGDYQKALDLHRQALEIRRELADLPGEAASLHGEGRALHRLGDDGGAIAALEEELRLQRTLKNPQSEGEALEELAVIARDRGDLQTAADRIREALDREEALRSQLTSPQLRSSFTAAEHDKYEWYIDLQQQRHRAEPAAGYDAAALEINERARARVLLESMLHGRVDLKQGIDPALLERERALQKQISDASAQLTRASSSGRSGADATTSAESLERLTADYERLQVEIRNRSPQYASLTQPKPLSAHTIQSDVLDDDTVLLEFALGDARSWLWAVTRQAILSVELPSRSTIESAARALYEQYTARQLRSGEDAAAYGARVGAADRGIQKDAAALSRMLLGGVASRLQGEWKGKRLAVVLAGALDYLPFAALPMPGDVDGVTLASEFEVVELPSASVLAAIRTETSSRPRASRAVAVVADPVFDRADVRVGSDHASVPARRDPRDMADASEERGLEFLRSDVEGHDEFAVGSGYARLPFTRREADAIASLVAREDVFEATDFQASRPTVLSGALQGYRIVHFATHGVLDDSRPALSGLILSLVDQRGNPQDGFLRLHDIYNTRVDADLVVLSACQTALGKQIRGEGLVGLARAFMYAGAPRVVASLWEVSDVATAELMRRFYRNMLQQNLTPAAALRSAQLEIAKKPQWRSPYYWAGFVLQGDWR